MSERCEFCGRFGASRERVYSPRSGATHITLYLCRKCSDSARLESDAERNADEVRRAFRNGIAKP